MKQRSKAYLWDAVQNACVNYTDLESGFIKAEVVAFECLSATSFMQEAKAQSKIRMDGKAHIMHDGEVAGFHFNV